MKFQDTLDELNQAITQADAVQLVDYIYLHTRLEDVGLMVLGFIVFVWHKYLSDRSVLEKKRKAANFDDDSFVEAFYPNRKNKDLIKLKFIPYYKQAKWNWKLWWDDHDEMFYTSLGFSVMLIFGVPEFWYRSSMNGVIEYNSLFSITIGYMGSQIGRYLIKKLKAKGDEQVI